ncbi:MAG: DUF1963 domain-containing protein [Planctomycetota bacterium]
MFTWSEETCGDPLAPRFGGPAPLPMSLPWPICAACHRPLTYIGTLDFRGTAIRTNVPADGIAVFFCLADGEGRAAVWLDHQQALRLVDSPPELKKKGRIGTPWVVADYPWTWDKGHTRILCEACEEDPILGGKVYKSVTVFGTKIGGHIFWIQRGQDIPKCLCGESMRFLGQFASYDDIMIGDAGILYLFSCARGTCDNVEVIEQCF